MPPLYYCRFLVSPRIEKHNNSETEKMRKIKKDLFQLGHDSNMCYSLSMPHHKYHDFIHSAKRETLYLSDKHEQDVFALQGTTDWLMVNT